jgi:hypothetical protein
MWLCGFMIKKNLEKIFKLDSKIDNLQCWNMKYQKIEQHITDDDITVRHKTQVKQIAMT